jgi:FkbM family methyltransferase
MTWRSSIPAPLRRVYRRLQPGPYISVPTPANVRLREITVGSVTLLIGDIETSIAADVVELELHDIEHQFSDGSYEFDDINFQPGDAVLDLGAHVGVISCYLAKRWPFLDIYAYEALPPVYDLLVANLRRNRITNVHPFNTAVSADGKPLELVAHLESNTGGGSATFSNLDLPGHQRFTAPSATIDDIISVHQLARVRLLKIDIEGSDHASLKACRSLSRVENLRGEIHENQWLRGQGHSAEELVTYCSQYLDSSNVRFTVCQIPDY